MPTIVRNLGTAVSGQFTVSYYLASNDVVDGTNKNILLKTVNKTSVAAGGSQQWTESVSIPAGIDPSVYSNLLIVVDPDDQIPELDESNNTANVAINLLPDINFAVVPSQVMGHFRVGQYINTTVLLANQANAQALQLP